MNRFAKFAAAAAVIIVVIGFLAWLVPGNGAATIAWADVQEHIRNARTVTYTMAMKMEGLPDVEVKMMFMEPGRMRQEMTMGPSKSITIMDMRAERMISLVEKAKKAVVVNFSALPEEIRKTQEEQDMLGRMKRLIEESETELGEKEIDGRLAKGYRVEEGNQVMTIWADALTGRPIEVEATWFQGEAETTMSNFEFDVQLDESLFSVEVPEGYTVEQKEIEFKEPSADDVVEMFRIWIKVRGGTFPDALTPGHFLKDCKDTEKGEFEEKGLKKGDGFDGAVGMARAWVLIAQHAEARYVGAGVELGDAGTAVFWYKPKDCETYKVIYGDLSVLDVEPDHLPKAPEAPAAGEQDSHK